MNTRGTSAPRPSANRCLACWCVAAGALALVGLSFWSLDLQWAQFVSAPALAKMGRFLAELLQPETSPAFLQKLLWATLETLAMSALGTLLAAAGGLAFIFGRDLTQQFVVEDEAVAGLALAMRQHFEPRHRQGPRQKRPRGVVVCCFPPEHAIGFLQHVRRIRGTRQQSVDGPIECALRRGEALDELAHLFGGHVGHVAVSAGSAEI